MARVDAAEGAAPPPGLKTPPSPGEVYPGRRLLTVPQIVKLSGLSQPEVRKLLEHGTWPGASQPGGVGSHWRIPKAEVLAWLETARTDG